MYLSEKNQVSSKEIDNCDSKINIFQQDIVPC